MLAAFFRSFQDSQPLDPLGNVRLLEEAYTLLRRYRPPESRVAHGSVLCLIGHLESVSQTQDTSRVDESKMLGVFLSAIGDCFSNKQNSSIYGLNTGVIQNGSAYLSDLACYAETVCKCPF